MAVDVTELRAKITKLGISGVSGVQFGLQLIVRVINKLGQLRSGCPICLTKSLITDRIGRHEVLLSTNHKYNKIRGKNKTKRTLLRIYHHYDGQAIFETEGTK